MSPRQVRNAPGRYARGRIVRDKDMTDPEQVQHMRVEFRHPDQYADGSGFRPSCISRPA
ncbi:MAG TPA: hypothetical protein PLV45_03760 [bacterium]|nr:hypothetical protein [bacterium]